MWALSASCHYLALGIFEPHLPVVILQLWTGLIAGFFGFWLVILGIETATRRRERLPGRMQILLTKTVVLAQGALICCDLWLLIPYGTVATQYLTILFCFAYLVLFFPTVPHWRAINYTIIVAVSSSIAATVFLAKVPFWQYVWVFILVFGFAIISLNSVLADAILGERDARQSAEAARDARTRFLAAASHDLGQPLQAARLYLHQAQRAEGAEQRGAATAKAGHALGAMERLLHSILDHMRLDAGKMVAKVTAIPAGPVIAQTAAMFEPAAALAGVRLIAVNTGLNIRADADVLGRALGNLVDNALRHADARRVLIGARRRGDRVRLYVIDDGRGVTAADLPRLFEEFVQGSESGGKQRGGFGLGLSVVRRSMQLMGGSAGIDPKWDTGSAFYLELPAT